MPTLAVVLMVKNESLRIRQTLNSVKMLDGIVIYDTGSTDDTLDIIKSECPHAHVFTGHFTNFAESRNKSLEYLNECGYDYAFLLDANDELVCDDLTKVKQTLDNNPSRQAFLVEQKLKYSKEDVVSFYNVKLVKCPTALKYKGVVHEYLDGCGNIERLPNVHIFQDKTKDDDKSCQRWKRDRILLEQEFEQDPLNTRCLFYLAQTYACLGDNKNALEKYSQRCKSVGGYEEERWYSYQQCGLLTLKLNPADYYDAITWFTKACEHTLRAEPLVQIAKIWRSLGKFGLAYSYAKLACGLPFPTSATLFVERRVYDYERWHLLGIVSYYAAKDSMDSDAILASGKAACQVAILAGNNVNLDTKNLNFYQE